MTDAKGSEKTTDHHVYLTSEEAADLVRLSPRTLDRHRVAGTGPAFIKVGRRVLYKRDNVEAWLTDHTFSSTTAAERA